MVNEVGFMVFGSLFLGVIFLFAFLHKAPRKDFDGNVEDGIVNIEGGVELSMPVDGDEHYTLFSFVLKEKPKKIKLIVNGCKAVIELKDKNHCVIYSNRTEDTFEYSYKARVLKIFKPFGTSHSVENHFNW